MIYSQLMENFVHFQQQKKKKEEKEEEDPEGKQEIKKELEEKVADNVVVLSETDEIWNKLRHVHFAEAMENVAKQVKEFQENDEMARFQANKNKGKKVELKTMVQAAKGLAEYKEQVAKFSKHQDLLKLILNLYNSKHLDKLGDLEQEMATGLTEEGQDVVVKKVKQRLVEKCQSEEIAVIDKMRLLMIYMISQGGIQKGTLQELMKTIHPSLKKALFNLPNLGVNIDVTKDKKAQRIKLSKERKEEFLKAQRENGVILMRYVPFLQGVMQKLIDWSLSRESFPYITPPKEGTKKPKATKLQRWHRRGEEKEDDRPLYIVFILGGVTYSEMRLIYTNPKLQNAKVIIGATDIITPARFIRGMADISKAQYRKGITDSEGNAKPDQNYAANTKNDSDVEDAGPEVVDEELLQPVQIAEPTEDDCWTKFDKCLDECFPWMDPCLDRCFGAPSPAPAKQ